MKFDIVYDVIEDKHVLYAECPMFTRKVGLFTSKEKAEEYIKLYETGEVILPEFDQNEVIS